LVVPRERGGQVNVTWGKRNHPSGGGKKVQKKSWEGFPVVRFLNGRVERGCDTQPKGETSREAQKNKKDSRLPQIRGGVEWLKRKKIG